MPDNRNRDYVEPDRVARFTERFAIERGLTEWPRVAEVARSLRVRQADVEQAAADDDRLMLTGYNLTQRTGELFVEAQAPEIERTWRRIMRSSGVTFVDETHGCEGCHDH